MRDKLTGILRSPAELATLGIAAVVIAATVATAGTNEPGSTPGSSSTAHGDQSADGSDALVEPYVSGRSTTRTPLPEETTRTRRSETRSTTFTQASSATDGSPLDNLIQWLTPTDKATARPGGDTSSRPSASPPARPGTPSERPSTNAPTSTVPVTTDPETPPPPTTTTTTPPPTTDPGDGGETPPEPSPTLEWTPPPSPAPTEDHSSTSAPEVTGTEG